MACHVGLQSSMDATHRTAPDAPSLHHPAAGKPRGPPQAPTGAPECAAAVDVQRGWKSLWCSGSAGDHLACRQAASSCPMASMASCSGLASRLKALPIACLLGFSTHT